MWKIVKPAWKLERWCKTRTRSSAHSSPAPQPSGELALRPRAPEWEELAAAAAAHTARQADRAPLVDVIVPVYRGLDDTLACLYSALRAENTHPSKSWRSTTAALSQSFRLVCAGFPNPARLPCHQRAEQRLCRLREPGDGSPPRPGRRAAGQRHVGLRELLRPPQGAGFGRTRGNGHAAVHQCHHLQLPCDLSEQQCGAGLDYPEWTLCVPLSTPVPASTCRRPSASACTSVGSC